MTEDKDGLSMISSTFLMFLIFLAFWVVLTEVVGWDNHNG